MQKYATDRMTDLLTTRENLEVKQRVGFIIPKFILQEMEKVTSKRGKSQFVARAIARAIDEKKKGRAGKGVSQEVSLICQ